MAATPITTINILSIVRPLEPLLWDVEEPSGAIAVLKKHSPLTPVAVAFRQAMNPFAAASSVTLQYVNPHVWPSRVFSRNEETAESIPQHVWKMEDPAAEESADKMEMGVVGDVVRFEDTTHARLW
jgi:hypothetical protein